MSLPLRIKLRTRSQGREYYFLLLPYLVGAFLLVFLPALLSFGLAFFRYDALSPPVWAGLQNFREINSEPLFWMALRNSLYFTLFAVPLRLIGALLLALLLKNPGRGMGAYRVAIYLPAVIPDAAYALIWLWIVNPLYGPLNGLLASLGLPLQSWLVDSQTAKQAIVLMSLFQIGEGFIVLLAGLRGISPDYYDAAKVDGGRFLQVFRLITLPLLAPWLILLTVRDIILTFQNTFAPAYLMTGGGPYYSTLFLPLEIYEEAFDRFRFGQASAMLLVMSLVTLALLAVLFWFFEGWGYDEDE